MRVTRPIPSSEKEWLRYWVDLVNARGHAGIHARRTHDDKKVIEASVIGDFQQALELIDGSRITSIEEREAPDFLLDVNGRTTTVELTEFVNQKILEKIAGGKRAAHSYSHFRDAQWTKDAFLSALSRLIAKKVAKYANRQEVTGIDILLIYTAEPWLSPQLVSEWLTEFCAPPLGKIGEVQFMMDYAPGHPPRYPLFLIKSDKT